MVRAIIEFIGQVWEVFWRALVLDEQLLQAALAAPAGRAGWIIVTIVVLAGAAQLLGQSVVLFLNKVTPRRFALSLLLNGVIFFAGLLVWSAFIWLAGRAFGHTTSFGLVARMVGLGSAPYVFSLFVLVPYAGPFLGRVVAVWSFLVTLGMLRFTYQTSFWSALLIVGVGWLVMVMLGALVGRPIGGARRRLFHREIDASLNSTAQELLRSIPAAPPQVGPGADPR